MTDHFDELATLRAESARLIAQVDALAARAAILNEQVRRLTAQRERPAVPDPGIATADDRAAADGPA